MVPPDSNETRRKLKADSKTDKRPVKRVLDGLMNQKTRKEAITKAQQFIRNISTSATDVARHVVSSEPVKQMRAYASDLHNRAASRSAMIQMKAKLIDSLERVKSQGTTTAVQMQGWANALLTTEFAKNLASWTADTFNKNDYTKGYDTAIDAAYNAGEGGSSMTHHLIDGSHTIVGAIRAASGVKGDDSNLTVVMNALEHLLRDLASRTGIQPFFSLSKEQLEALQNFVGEFGVSKLWVDDFLQLNVPEVLGAFFAVVPVWFGWTKLDAEKFAEIAGSAGIAALISANPLLGLVAMVSMARSFNLLISKEQGAFRQAANKAGFGAVQSSVVWAASAVIPGPAAVGILVGLVIAYTIRSYTSTDMTHEEMVRYITQIYTARILPSISSSAEVTLALFRSLQKRFPFDTTTNL